MLFRSTGREGMAGQYNSRVDFVVFECVVPAHLDVTAGDLGATRSTDPALAREGQIRSVLFRCIENRLVSRKCRGGRSTVESNSHLAARSDNSALTMHCNRRSDVVDVEQLVMDAIL